MELPFSVWNFWFSFRFLSREFFGPVGSLAYTVHYNFNSGISDFSRVIIDSMWTFALLVVLEVEIRKRRYARLQGRYACACLAVRSPLPYTTVCPVLVPFVPVQTSPIANPIFTHFPSPVLLPA